MHLFNGVEGRIQYVTEAKGKGLGPGTSVKLLAHDDGETMIVSPANSVL